MKTIITWVALGLFLYCNAVAQITKPAFTEEEIQANIDTEDYLSSQSNPIIDYCWREGKTEFLKQYMASQHLQCRAYMFRTIEEKERQGGVEDDLLDSLILHTLKTDKVWQRPPKNAVDHMMYETLFMKLVKEKFPEIALKNVNAPLERKQAIKHIQGVLGEAIEEQSAAKSPNKRRPPRLSNDDTESLLSSSNRKQSTSEKDEVSAKGVSAKYWITALLVLLSSAGLWGYLRRKS